MSDIKKPDKRDQIIEFCESASVMMLIFLIIYIFLARPTVVYGSSMEPKLFTGERLITEEISYRFSKPSRGDIVVVKSPIENNQELIKRIIGLPGETIMIDNGSVYINSQRLTENYLPQVTQTEGKTFLKDGQSYQIPSDQYIVLGDNREVSLDSRYFGPIAYQDIVGKAVFTYWPIPDFGIIK